MLDRHNVVYTFSKLFSFLSFIHSDSNPKRYHRVTLQKVPYQWHIDEENTTFLILPIFFF